MNGIIIRKATPADILPIVALYKSVARTGGLAYAEKEISEAYVSSFVSTSLKQGCILVMHTSQQPEILVGEIHGYTLGLQTFAHVIEQVTMAIHPDFQGKGLGSRILADFQQEIRNGLPHILKVELMCFGNNQKAYRLYLRHSFIVEGRRKNRVKLNNGTLVDGLAMAWFNPDYQAAK